MPPSFLCPSCHVRLFSARAPDVTMLVCKQCAGVWLDNVGSRLAAEARLSEFAQQVARMLDQTRPGVRKQPALPYRSPADPPRSERTCPLCSQTLQRARVEVARTDLDICPSHGTWFDRHELWSVVQAVEVQKLESDFEYEQDMRRVREMTREAHGPVLGHHHHDPTLDAVGIVVGALLR